MSEKKLGHKKLSQKKSERKDKLAFRIKMSVLALIIFLFGNIIRIHIVTGHSETWNYWGLIVCLGLLLIMIVTLLAINNHFILRYKKQLSQALEYGKSQSMFLDGVLYSNSVALMYLDKKLNIAYASKRLLKELAINDLSFIGKSIYNLISNEQFNHFLSDYLGHDNKESSEIISFHNQNGQQIWFWIEIQTIYGENEIPHYLLTFEDATSTFHAQTLLEASMEVTSNLILFFGNNGRLVYCSEIAAKKIGYHSRLEAVGMHFRELYQKNIGKDIIDGIEKELNRGNRFHDTCNIDFGDNNSKWFNTDAVNIMISEERYGIVVFLNDITEQVRKSQELLETVKLRERLIMTMSHEIRTPMNAIMGSSDLLVLSDQLRGKNLTYVNNIKEASRVLINIIDEVTDYTKIEAAEIEIQNEPFYLDDLIKELYSLVNTKAKEKDLRVLVDIDQLIPKIIITDKNRLKQVLRHLLLNAVKFTSHGCVKLKISRLDQDGTMYLNYMIEDTGKGIECDNKETFFDTYTLMKREKDHANLGLGLGLVICRQLVALMGGNLSFESVKGKGSTFYFALATEKKEDKVIVKKDDKKVDVIFETRDVEVLVVDDNDVNLLVATSMLKQFDIAVDQVSSGMEAVNMAANHNYDIIFMDYLMPKMNGLEATKIIRSQKVDGKNLVIIALSANVVNETRRLFEGDWVNDVISKPLEIKNIAEILKKWLPKDKIIKKEKEDTANVGNQEIRHIFEVVEQIDYELGLSYLGGGIEDYIKVLEMSFDNMKTRIMHLGTFNYEKDMEMLKIEVHSIKGILLNIGATKLSQLSKEIEEAIIDKKVDFVLGNMGGYIQAMQEFLEQFGQALITYSQYYKRNQQEETATHDFMSEEDYEKAMKKLVYHISRYEYIEINEVLGKLIKGSNELRKSKLLQVDQFIKEFKYEEALKVITENA